MLFLCILSIYCLPGRHSVSICRINGRLGEQLANQVNSEKSNKYGEGSGNKVMTIEEAETV